MYGKVKTVKLCTNRILIEIHIKTKFLVSCEMDFSSYEASPNNSPTESSTIFGFSFRVCTVAHEWVCVEGRGCEPILYVEL